MARSTDVENCRRQSEPGLETVEKAWGLAQRDVEDLLFLVLSVRFRV